MWMGKRWGVAALVGLVNAPALATQMAPSPGVLYHSAGCCVLEPEAYGKSFVIRKSLHYLDGRPQTMQLCHYMCSNLITYLP